MWVNIGLVKVEQPKQQGKIEICGFSPYKADQNFSHLILPLDESTIGKVGPLKHQILLKYCRVPKKVMLGLFSSTNQGVDWWRRMIKFTIFSIILILSSLQVDCSTNYNFYMCQKVIKKCKKNFEQGWVCLRITQGEFI